MSFFQTIKSVLSPHQDSLIKATSTSNYDEALRQLFFDEKDKNLQKTLAPILREITINHFKNSESDFVKKGKEVYEVLYNAQVLTQSYEDNLNYQARNYVWATEVEAGALAEALNVTLIITPLSNHQEDTSLIPWKSTDKDVLIFRLYNQNNTHWFAYPKNPEGTIGDGNCLYNGFALLIRQAVLYEKLVLEKSDDPESDDERQRLIQHQNECLEKLVQTEETSVDDFMVNNLSNYHDSDYSSTYFLLNCLAKLSGVALLLLAIAFFPPVALIQLPASIGYAASAVSAIASIGVFAANKLMTHSKDENRVQNQIA